ncbi:MAG: 6-carboxytetrahydropterin synthase [Armatimonadetes bacterium]|nr:6-carboxytetrahydropterin synthase [Armatimonadota bacterium]
MEDLDRVVHDEVISRYNYRHLNQEAEEFQELNPTAENLERLIWGRLQRRLKGVGLYKITVRETGRNAFTDHGEED